MHIELRMLRALVMVEASGSITRAADGLAFSPAAVSEHLRALERECGVRLVERTGSGTALTEEGRRAVPIARLMLAAAVELERLGRRASPSRSGAIPPGPSSIKSNHRDREVR
ncbi:helix-turn-helix domain-containing protein [Aeromicrobium sp.]|uniref:helix-turn-helix domain-containing protein n=1 Tax=Aeromicrobium sp. TaxID=1871063 RepID=UPI0010DAAECA|nr:MAG: LysR family transcriptional regulator [Actinomycetales bacterium]